MSPKFWFLILIGSALISTAGAALTTDNWISSLGGKWETGIDWSTTNAPSIAQSVIMITNGLTAPSSIKTVLIDQTTVTTAPASMTISNLIIGGRGFFSSGIQNDLILSNTQSTALNVLNSVLVSNRSTILVTNSVLNVGGAVRIEGSVALDDGTITTPSAVTIALTGTALWEQLGGTWLANNVTVGAGSNVQGVLDILGGTVTMSSSGEALDIGSVSSSAGTVLLAGGLLNTTNGTAEIGERGVGQMSVSNATWLAGFVGLGDVVGSQGTLTVADGGSLTVAGLYAGISGTGTVWLTGGQIDTMDEDVDLGDFGVGFMTISNGTCQGNGIVVGDSGYGAVTLAGGVTTLSFELDLGLEPGSTGEVSLTGGQLVIDDFTVIGDSGVGYMFASGGTWQSGLVEVGAGSGSRGTLMVEGGTNSAYSGLSIGNPNCSGTGSVTVSGGSLFVTNAAHNSVLDLESGTLTMLGGTLAVDVLVKTNPCASFSQIAGTLIVGGVTNTVPPLPFQITALSIIGNNIIIRWQSPGGGMTNFVQATNGNPDGSYNTNFVDISTPLVLDTPGTYQYDDLEGALNRTSRYYRVRQAP